MIAVAYCRVSSAGQAREGASLSAQEQACRARCEQGGWELAKVVLEQASTMKGQPERDGLLDLLDAGEFAVLIVTRQDRLARSTAETYDIMDRANKHGWALVFVDQPIDMTTPMGRAMAGVAAVFAQLEREMISVRTREAIAERKRQGTYRGFDRPQSRRVHGEPRDEIMRLHKQSPRASSEEVAHMLDILGVPTPRGGEYWSPNTVRMVINRECGRCKVCTERKRRSGARRGVPDDGEQS